MKDDVSQVASGGCNVLNSSDTLYNYNGARRYTYKFNGGKWYLYRTEYNFNNQNYDISSYTCINLDSLKSYAVYEPILNFMALCLVILVIYLFFKIIRGLLYAFSK